MIRSFSPDPIRRLFCITVLLAGTATASAASAATALRSRVPAWPST